MTSSAAALPEVPLAKEVKIDEYLELLKRKGEEDVPMRMRGLDVNSCTATAGAVVHWLSPPATGNPLTLTELEDKKPLTDYATTEAVRELLAQSPALCVFAFHTPHHKFAVLRVDDTAALLHSNQDGTLGGETFTLQEWLTGKVRNHRKEECEPCITIPFLSMMILNLAAAAAGNVPHQDVFQMYFGSPFKKDIEDKYWLVVKPVAHISTLLG